MVVLAHRAGQVATHDLGRQETLLLQHAHAIGEVAQLTDVAGPAIALEQLDGLGGELERRHVVLIGALRGEEAEEQGDVLGTRAQGRDLDGNGIEAEEQVLTEASARHGLL